MRVKRGESAAQKGFSLPMALLAVSVLAALAVASLMQIRPSRASGHAYQRGVTLQLAEKSAREAALGLLIVATNRPSFVIHMISDEKNRPQYYVASWYEPNRQEWMHQPLVSATEVTQLASTDESDRYLEYNGELNEGEPLIEMSELSWGTAGRFSQAVPAVELENGLSYSYWIEDLNGRIDFEALNYQSANDSWSYDRFLSEDEQEQRARDMVRDHRHLGLTTLSSGSEGVTEFPVNYEEPFSPRLVNELESVSPPDHPLVEFWELGLPPYLARAEIVRSSLEDEYKDLVEYCSFGLADTIEVEAVPYGLEYANAGTVKLNLNEELRLSEVDGGEASVDKVAERIKQVRGFKDNAAEYEAVGIEVSEESPVESRYGGFPTGQQSYCKTLAANILDYADRDHAPSQPAGGNSGNYRGVDSYPFYTESSRRYYLSDATELGAVLQIRNFIELYNPTDKPIHGFLKTRFSPSGRHRVSLGGAEYALPPEELFYWDGLIVIEPNSYRVLELTQDLDGDKIGDPEAYLHYELASGGGGNAITAGRTASEGNQLEIYWSPAEPEKEEPDQFYLVDGLIHGGFDISSTSLIDTLEKNANNTLHGIALYEGMTGDPRATFYNQNEDVGALNYALRTSFGGPNDYQLDESGKINNASLFPSPHHDALNHGKDVRGCTSTPSRGMRYPGEHGYVKWDNPEGVKGQDLELASGDMISQFYVEQSRDHHLRSLQSISNQGYFTSLGELGNVFDPAQWSQVYQPTKEVDGEIIRNPDYLIANYGEDKNGAPLEAEELGVFGGGMTLAIGSPEFHCFASLDGDARRGYEGARLLDQFRVTDSPLRSLKSRINLNTAPRAVLQALFAGITNKDDEVMKSFTRAPRNAENEVASVFADGIIAARKERPFLALSDIALAKSLYEDESLPLFGEKIWYQGGSFDVRRELWSDLGREELFRKSCDLFTTQSRSYRIHIQVEQEGGDYTSTIRKSFDVTLHPYLNEDRSIDQSRPPQVKFHHQSEK